MTRRALLISCLLAAWCAGARLHAGTPDKHPHIGYVYPAGGQRGTTVDVKLGGEDVYGATAAIVSGKGVSVQVTDSREPEGTGDKKKNKAKKRNQTVIDEIITLRITIARDAEPAPREICLVTPDGLTNKLAFQVGQLKEVREAEPNNRREDALQLPPLPVLVNGQTMPGDVDMARFSARKGQRLVIVASARALIPYIADAVPGWFQAILTLYDAQGKEVAVADEFRFNPDPVLFYDVPANGEYTLSIRDSIYRGREDFVYRVEIGELPFITSVFPLGAPRGDTPVAVKLTGRNISADPATVSVDQEAPAIRYISVPGNGLLSNRVPFAIGDLPETTATDVASEPRASASGMVGASQQVTLPVVINGCIRVAGQKDSYSFEGKKGQAVCLEVRARRLGSPLDSYIVLLNSRGEKIGENDDIKDRSEGLLTHVADSELVCALPEDGTYTARIADTQGKCGGEYAYRLRISPPTPDFDLRMTPSAVSIPKGGSGALTVHAIRKDGFTGEIKLSLDEPAAGLSLDGAVIPEGADKVRLTMSVSEKAAVATIVPTVRGTGVVGGRTVSRVALPAEDLMQAFIYQHLVPCKEQAVMVTAPAAPFHVSPQLPAAGYLELPIGKEVSFPVSVTRGKGFDGPIQVRLVDAPKGIVLRKGWIGAGRKSGVVSVCAESTADSKLLRENLIFSGIMTLEAPAPPGGSAPKPPEKAAAKPAVPPPPVVKTPEKKAADDAPSELTIGPRMSTPAADDKAGKPTTPAPPPPPPAPASKVPAPATKGGNGPPPERVITTLPAVPFRTVENPDAKDAKKDPAPPPDTKK